MRNLTVFVLILIAVVAATACKSDKPSTSAAGGGSSVTSSEEPAPAVSNERPGDEDCRSTQDFKSVERCVELCKAAHENACYVAGTSYADGDKVERDETKAFRNFELGCRMNSGTSCKRLAAIYAIGLPGVTGFKASAERAASTYKYARERLVKECSRKQALPCSELAGMFEEGLGGPVDKALAATHRKQACELGVKADCT
ncbi:MAG: sel1 repeat family protein [Deltaproteobacteria bacterium]|nr:sel1 repeat family protein [Deltaproteobacteria bacterium]